MPSMDRVFAATRVSWPWNPRGGMRRSIVGWALRQTTIRTGHVNPGNMTDAYQLHRLILELAPYHLTISPLDIDFVELLFGFDLECKSNHDTIVFDALFSHSPLGRADAACPIRTFSTCSQRSAWRR